MRQAVTSSFFKNINNPQRKPTDRLEYWHSCKVEYSENGNIKHAVTKGINHRDVLQLAREAAKYVYAQYAWTRDIVPEVLRDQAGEHSIIFVKKKIPIIVTVKFTSFKKMNLRQWRAVSSSFVRELCRYWHIL